jgi:nucleoside-diphosphate-sugar epimerase
MRIFPSYGVGENKNRLFPKIKRLAKKGKNMIIENPYEYRDFTDVDYVAKVLLDACKFNKKRKFEIFHVSSTKPTSIKEFSEKIWKKYKATGKLIFKNQNKKYKRHVSSTQSIWKLTNEQ